MINPVWTRTLNEALSLHVFGLETPMDGDALAVHNKVNRMLEEMLRPS